MVFHKIFDSLILKSIQNNRGLTVVAAMLQVAVVLIAFAAFMIAKSDLMKANEKPNREISKYLVHDNMFNILQDHNAWALSLVDPANPPELKACYDSRDATNCNPLLGPNWRPLERFIDAAGNVIIDDNNDELGWDQAGAVCSTFDSSPGSCPYRLKIEWRILCSNPSCSWYEIELHSLFLDHYKIKTQPDPIESKYSIYMRL